MADLQTSIAQNLASVRQRLRQAAVSAGRSPDAVRLLAVSKTFSLGHVRAAAAAGQQDFGENRVQEALQKIDGSTDLQIRWHLIGTLQSNKVRKAVPRFSTVHSVDSLPLLRAIDAAAAETVSAPELLVQVDLAGEATKHGAPPAVATEIVKAASRCRSARAVGLMTIPPFFENPEDARPYFAQLRDLRAALLKEGLDPALLRELSMGMSHDFEIAVQEGATMVRLGTAIFGERHV
ncbi:MAG TPA: YggS family pyridoxal phosphate-dependent enzyme [Vicinamibacterales bacterium]|nr:YggS family pyridoxal phosphate-dependent enzyme [Vicinamibacterales bacterium]